MFTERHFGLARLPASRDSSLVTANGPLPRAVRSFWRHVLRAAGAARFLVVIDLSRPLRITAAALATLIVTLLAAPLALADNGVGLAGPTTDKTITFFCFGVIGFFAILVIVLSIIQGRLDARKDRRRHDLERYG